MSRRAFIGGAAAAGAVTVTAGIPGVAAAAAVPADRDGDLPTTTGTVVARVRDVRTGEITIYAGTREITYTDRVLARRLARAAAL